MTAVAAKAGFSVAYLSQIESGKKTPSVATIAKIADAIAEAKRGAA
jgi:transcriptional regulator with XRE-family HTH domain